MYLSENFNVTQSAIFYQFMREALIEQVGNNVEAIEYLKEAPDTDILSYAVLGKKAPADIDSMVYEQCLLDKVKDVVIDNAATLSECFDTSGNIVSEFISEIGVLQMSNSQQILKEDFSSFLKGPKNIVGDELDNLESGGKLVKNPTHAEPGGVMAWFNKMKDKFANNFPKVNQFIQNHGKQVGVAALVAIAGYMSYKAYQNYFSKAARACAGKSGEAKTVCMQNFKTKANQERVRVLQKSMAMCKKATNPAKCKQELQNKIAKLRS